MTRPIRIGIIGFGLATGPMIGPIVKHGGYTVVGCADGDSLARERFEEKFGQPAFPQADELLEVVKPDVVYIAAPTRFHEDLTIRALELGIHVLVEKPITTTLESAQKMQDTAKRVGRVLMVNHKRSADREIVIMRMLISSGRVGRVFSANRWHFSDWFYRARAAEERRPPDGGVVVRQGAHEFDILRALLPSTAVRLRGWVGDRDPDRPGEGAYHAWIECADDTVATSQYNGYDRFLSDELTGALLPTSVIGHSRRGLAENAPTAEAEYDLKRTVGHPRAPEQLKNPYGFTLVNGDAGDVRPAPGGQARLYDGTGRHLVTLQGPAGNALIIDELYQAIVHDAAPLHDAAWGLACLELCLAIRESATSGEAVTLHHQGAVPDQNAGRAADHRLEFSDE